MVRRGAAASATTTRAARARRAAARTPCEHGSRHRALFHRKLPDVTVHLRERARFLGQPRVNVHHRERRRIRLGPRRTHAPCRRNHRPRERRGRAAYDAIANAGARREWGLFPRARGSRARVSRHTARRTDTGGTRGEPGCASARGGRRRRGIEANRSTACCRPGRHARGNGRARRRGERRPRCATAHDGRRWHQRGRRAQKRAKGPREPRPRRPRRRGRCL